ncbi:class I SAM-dependent methyltransferase [Aeoliella mucimassa]|uniref:Ubiquinone/menaquinone biosynthesis C-methyltransferase UbiE n=1 Tax=Aeoliella mucimassa TaxID=2527972 RepID=A0A518AL43_9BACT|nr:class I SAM-dependent methyltransferase [Aeoliella mucimassa]QDU55431.1 Ubiquinone/menaquinone biosynthesis C-methyltransferase UbiE [Aeoliella mucimassa]
MPISPHIRRFFAVFTILATTISPAALLAQEKDPKDSRETANNTQNSDRQGLDRGKTPAERLNPQEFMGRRIANTMHYLAADWLTRTTREREEACSKLLKALPIERGQTVCDLGCGNGFYTLQLARRVGSKGTVWAVDIQPEMLELLGERAKARRITNIRPTLGKEDSPQLPEGELDLVLLVDVYHEFSHPKEMLAAMRASLKPTGRIALVEYRAEDPTVPIRELHKMTQSQAMKEYTANGFKLVGQYDELPWQHVFYFARDDSPLEEVELKTWERPADEQ